MIRNLGRVLSILARAETAEIFAHADVDAFGAPSECHGLVAKGEDRRRRRARKHAEAVARAPFRVIQREAQRRGQPLAGPRWEAFIGRVYDAAGFPF